MYEPERPLEPPEDKIYGYCNLCGGEIYEGDTIYEINGQLIHEECLEEFAKDYFSGCRTEARPEVEVGIRVTSW